METDSARLSKRWGDGSGNQQIFLKPAFDCPLWSLADWINENSTEMLKKREKRKNRSYLQQKFQELGRRHFKAATIAAPPEKNHALEKNFQEQDIKTPSREGTKADEREKQIRKRQLRAEGKKGNRQEMNNCWAGFFKKHLREVCHNGISPPTPVSRSVAQTGSAPRSGRGGRRFKSSHSDHFSLKII